MKKIPIEELMDRASKGPFRSVFFTGEYSDGALMGGGGENIAVISGSNYGFWSDKCSKKEDVDAECEANAHLIKHCLNNFKPLLEALEKLRDYTLAGNSALVELAIKEADKAIKAASEVEVPE